MWQGMCLQHVLAVVFVVWYGNYILDGGYAIPILMVHHVYLFQYF